MKNLKIIFSFVILVSLCSLTAFAQGSPTYHSWWYTLERGKLMFRQGDYGNALLAFDDARRQRRDMYGQMERDFIDLLSTWEARRIGDTLEWIENFIRDQNYTRAADALDELYYRIPKESLHDSAVAALAAIGTLKDYPEAEQWIGEVYLIEGEMGLALAQFQKALELRHLYENPGSAVDVLYKIADIRRVRQDYNEMERILLSILDIDNLWSNNSAGNNSGTALQANAGPAVTAAESFARQVMARTLENNGVDRFLELYRYHNAASLAAHQQLGFYYNASGRHSRAQEHLMFAFLIQNTVIIDELTRRQFDFSFTTLEALAAEISRYPILSQYAEKNEYYKTAYYLSASLYGNGKTETARGIWNSLSSQSHAGEWQTRSIAQLRSPFVERALEMP